MNEVNLTKEEYVRLRLVELLASGHCDTDMLLEKIKKLAGYVLGEDDVKESETPEAPDYSKIPVSSMLVYIRTKSFYGKNAGRIESALASEGIHTVGQMLEVGRLAFSRLSGIGKGALMGIDDYVKDELKMKGW